MEGLAGIIKRLRAAAAEAIALKISPMPVRTEDVIAAGLSMRLEAPVPPRHPGQPLVINWIMVPAGVGSGGHTTMFRIICYLEAHGYQNRIYFYNVYGGDCEYYQIIARNSYGFTGEVIELHCDMKDAHAVIATSWATSYPAFHLRCAGKRFYFVQDFEPYFYPAGAFSLLAENTYRMGFHGITAGRWLAEKLTAEFGMPADYFDFGCDSVHYHRLENAKRSGIVFYARPEAARRGFELGLMALELFAAMHPEIDIHFYGEHMGDLPFRFFDHGHISPRGLNELYNQCFAGLSLSLTNVSLVPHEMLAAGCIPVVNDAVHNRMVLDNAFVRYAAPNPQALAAELESVITTRDFGALSRAAAASVRLRAWDEAGATVASIIETVLSTEQTRVIPGECSTPYDRKHVCR
jgi:hypothetical protein